MNMKYLRGGAVEVKKLVEQQDTLITLIKKAQISYTTNQIYN